MPYPWALGFWFVWPWIVVTMTAKYWRILSGEDMAKEQVKSLRKDLAKLTQGIKKKE